MIFNDFYDFNHDFNQEFPLLEGSRFFFFLSFFFFLFNHRPRRIISHLEKVMTFLQKMTS